MFGRFLPALSRKGHKPDHFIGATYPQPGTQIGRGEPNGWGDGAMLNKADVRPSRGDDRSFYEHDEAQNPPSPALAAFEREFRDLPATPSSN